MTKPNRYVLGGNQRLKLTPKDQDGVFFVPAESRLSVQEPAGTIITVSGSDTEMAVASGYMYYLYKPPTVGWYEYESWVKDSEGNERVETKGFEVYDKVN